MSALTIAVTQFELRAERSVEQFLAHMNGLVAEGAARGAELVLFPEFSSTGLLGSITDHQVTTESVTSDYWNVLSEMTDDLVEGMKRMAAEHDIVIVGGSHNRIANDGSLRNTAYVVHPAGRVEFQDKIHLTPPEHSMGARGGDGLLVTKIGAFTVGLLICADIQFPELTRYLVSKGVDLILCPSLTWNRRGAYRVRIGCHARAIENQLYVAMSPLNGSNGLPVDAPLHTTGSAIVTGPVDKVVGSNDGVMAVASTDQEEVLVVELDRDLLLASREKPEPPGLKLRRQDLYEKLRTMVDEL
jgi:predicted amidohydrolase